ncbi:hypothetical protein N6H14_15750 [Paenibacillus sp. CC-CFT747]|nr:hypothetical protein N6H14_15750 [Paenibacillus sp. CC-CFT747]
MNHRHSVSDRLLLSVIYFTLAALSLLTLLPLLQIVTISVSPSEIVNRYGFHLIPLKLDWGGYREVFRNSLIWNAYGNTIFRTVLGTAITVVMTFLGAYPLSKKKLPHRKFWTGVIVITMFFSGG